MDTLWNFKNKTTVNKNLNKDIETDILIIGAGMTGITLGYFLKDNKKVTIVDKNAIGQGITSGSTAKINYLQGSIYTKIKTLRGKKYAIEYLNSQKDAIKILKEIIDKESIKCSFKKVPSYIFANTQKELKNLKKEIKFLRDQKNDIQASSLPSKITSYASYKVEDTYIFNPLEYLKELHKIVSKNIQIYENTKIIKIDCQKDNYYCYTSKNVIKAKKVILATHYPYFIFPFLLPLKSYCEKSYIIISKVNRDGNFTCINTSNPIYSCRYYKDGKNTYQISLSESHNIAFKQNDDYHFKRVEEIFDLKKEDIIMKYSNIDIITPDYLPFIGRLKKDLYIACGFNTWGMTNSVLAARIISDMLKEKTSSYTKMFNPNRITLANILTLPYIAFSQIKSFLGPKIIKNKGWYKENLAFFKEDGIDYAIYKDPEGNMHKVINKCPHLGCSLIFNEVEKTWDCPCHSSRFDIDGHCIKGPSNYDIKPK